MPTPGPLELVIILVIALLILGPGKLPDVGAALGKSIREFRKASSDVQEAVSRSTRLAARRPRRRPPCAPRRARPSRRRTVAEPPAPAPVAAPADRPPDAPPASPRPPPTELTVRLPRTRPTWPTLTPCATPGVGRRPGPARARPATGDAPGDETVMSLVDHLGELRTRLFRSILAVAVCVGRRVRGRGPDHQVPGRRRSRATTRCTSPGLVTRSSSRSRSRSWSGSSWRCRSCSTSAGRSSRRA